ncbi:type I DNA topoisomerase [Mycoplasma sp. 1018B]|uniref:type I DNA topoisomerase n=1 Tax=Mycoplasma sp. 1018B TaxID=2967302 RepID=UPI00211C86FF|nr:type I DNA topoisomerase [Mycoplasma sp. 1018B]UUM19148.1 type I DNA topoisomerase [Mycoplasma sp. 1018B]
MFKLVIVESPNKVATIKKYLGSDYEVMASVGHIMKLSTTGLMKLGIDLDKWEPKYVLDKSKNDIVNKLKKAAKEAQWIYIATDPDREGESIGNHLVKALKVENKYNRIKYNEITKVAILNALENPKKIDDALVDAQKARRMLDRIIGFRLSALMNTKLSNSPTFPSAGRVQSIALKLIIDRENEIEKFIPLLYSKLSARIKHENNFFDAFLYIEQHKTGQKSWIFEDELDFVKKELAKEPQNLLLVKDVKELVRKNIAVTPFKQSVLYKKSPYSSIATQAIMQRLYEGYGDGGLITYPRTDSTRLSETFVSEAKKYIMKIYGNDYVAEEIKGFSGEQDAHEAIRPTNIALKPQEALNKYSLTKEEFNIYKLIYDNTLKALIKPPVFKIINFTFSKNELTFKLSTSEIIFKGYYIINDNNDNNIEEDENILTIKLDYKIGDKVFVSDFIFSEHQTLPPSRYSEGSLIEALDNIKVGRPSTFASTVKIVLERQYAQNVKGVLLPTEFGKVVLSKLLDGFPNIINESYTAQVEEQLDLIANNNLSVPLLMNDFWNRFNSTYDMAKEKLEKTAITSLILEEKCPVDNGDLIEKNSKFGKFIGCSNFPKCNYSQPIIDKEQCPNDQGALILKKSKFGYFFACQNYPQCNYIKNNNKKYVKKSKS